MVEATVAVKIIAAEEVKAEALTKQREEEGWVKSRLEEGSYLPPIHRIKMPETRTQTAKIRWLHALGYEVKEIASALNVRYQQVRNMVTTIPKRAAREDLPELVIELLDIEDEVDMLLDAELDRGFAEERKRNRRKNVSEEDLDDENHGR